jgi:hypothetical protein
MVLFILVVIMIGLLVGLAIKYLEMPPLFKTALPILALVLIVLWLIAIVAGGVPDIPMPRFK